MDFLRSPEDRDWRGNSDHGGDQVAMQFVYLGNRFVLEGHDDIAFFQAGPFRRASRLETRHQHAVVRALPPSTNTSMPLMNPESSRASQGAALGISSINAQP